MKKFIGPENQNFGGFLYVDTFDPNGNVSQDIPFFLHTYIFILPSLEKILPGEIVSGYYTRPTNFVVNTMYSIYHLYIVNMVLFISPF